MKVLLVLAIAAIGFFSCKKESFELTKKETQQVSPTQEETQQVLLNLSEIDLFFFFEEEKINGEIKFWIGNELDTVINTADVVLSDTIFPYSEIPLKVAHIKLYCTNSELVNCDGWFHISANFTDTFQTLFNVNKFNNSNTFGNDDLSFLEFSDKIDFDVIDFYNSFWVKRNVIATDEYIENSFLK